MGSFSFSELKLKTGILTEGVLAYQLRLGFVTFWEAYSDALIIESALVPSPGVSVSAIIRWSSGAALNTLHCTQ